MVRLLFASLVFMTGLTQALELRGELTQGSLLRGELPPGSQVWLNDKPVRVSDNGFLA